MQSGLLLLSTDILCPNPVSIWSYTLHTPSGLLDSGAVLNLIDMSSLPELWCNHNMLAASHELRTGEEQAVHTYSMVQGLAQNAHPRVRVRLCWSKILPFRWFWPRSSWTAALDAYSQVFKR